MAVHEIQHPHWGSNFANQLSFSPIRSYGENESGYNTVTVQGFFGPKQKKQFVGWIELPTTDNDSVRRYFQHRCGLLKIVVTPHRNGPMSVVFLDGHVASNFISSNIEFRFAPDTLKENDGKPIAEIWFSGEGTRYGPLDGYDTSRIICTFANKEHMDQHLYLTNRRMPKFITYRGVTYSATSSGQYQSSDNSILSELLVMYSLLSPDEQQTFVAQNPEVQSLLGDTEQDEVVFGDVDSNEGTYSDDDVDNDADSDDSSTSSAGGGE
jgi:prepilin-type processing-associated H-X9-DG protein